MPIARKNYDDAEIVLKEIISGLKDQDQDKENWESIKNNIIPLCQILNYECFNKKITEKDANEFGVTLLAWVTTVKEVYQAKENIQPSKTLNEKSLEFSTILCSIIPKLSDVNQKKLNPFIKAVLITLLLLALITVLAIAFHVGLGAYLPHTSTHFIPLIQAGFEWTKGAVLGLQGLGSQILYIWNSVMPILLSLSPLLLVRLDYFDYKKQIEYYNILTTLIGSIEKMLNNISSENSLEDLMQTYFTPHSFFRYFKSTTSFTDNQIVKHIQNNDGVVFSTEPCKTQFTDKKYLTLSFTDNQIVKHLQNNGGVVFSKDPSNTKT